MIVDDDENIAELISLYLTKECFNTRIVHDGESAMREFDTYGPNLVLLDLMLPDISGYTVRPGFENPGSRFLLKHLRRRKIQYFCSHQ